MRSASAHWPRIEEASGMKTSHAGISSILALRANARAALPKPVELAVVAFDASFHFRNAKGVLSLSPGLPQATLGNMRKETTTPTGLCQPGHNPFRVAPDPGPEPKVAARRGNLGVRDRIPLGFRTTSNATRLVRIRAAISALVRSLC